MACASATKASRHCRSYLDGWWLKVRATGYEGAGRECLVVSLDCCQLSESQLILRIAAAPTFRRSGRKRLNFLA